MIRRLDVALRSDLAVAPVDRGLALFEAAMMTRCASLPREHRAFLGTMPVPPASALPANEV